MQPIRAALAALRAAGFALGVVSNRPGVARGLVERTQLEAVQARAEALLGPLDVWAVRPHGPHDGCGCRMPSPVLVTAACRALGVPAARVTVVCSTDAVADAALTSGAHPIRVLERTAGAGCPPCTLTAHRTAGDPVQAVEILLRV
ncbi:hypothetical protein ACFVVU_03655 [Kitasatospora sp. NPDC057965]|uniref:hypothetical protein n=1 Tax=Kitasatospora sp. NPDC057965 TaxID=3346291 RepID=UPI0036DA2AB0